MNSCWRRTIWPRRRHDSRCPSLPASVRIRTAPESEGTLGPPEPSAKTCPKCKGGPVVYQTWESHCGSYVDDKYTCEGCGHVWWIDGPDA